MVHLDDKLLLAQSYPNLQQFAKITKASLKAPLNRMKPQDKMPPRFNVKGMSVAVRVLGHEIRHVTYKTTGKDLVDLRDSCPDILKKIGQAAKDTKIPFANLTIPSFDFPNRNFNEFDFNGYCTVQQWEKFQVSEVPKVEEPKKTFPDEICTCNVEESGYAWTNERIREQELQSLMALLPAFKTKSSTHKNSTDHYEDESSNADWNLFMKFKDYNVWRQKIGNGGKYMYKIHGSYDDVCAKSFYQTQIDDSYRRIWDSYALGIDVVENDPLSECEIVRWTTKCPYPMKSREYLFLRSSKIYDKEQIAVVLSRSTEHPEWPESDDYVRCGSYDSKMAIKPHKNFEENGMEFVLIYSDDPQTVLPTYVLDMLATSGITEMMTRLRQAAKDLEDVKMSSTPSSILSNSDD
eukprot:Seg4124.3 transcript_id=Seg4124.3/GoldUCD/mRNA.D3Y31 product="StAR-related lipid transfer protein 7 mitochondrial" protein_id=Seg4124.3/GoldUCD/D3Y31